MGDRGKWDHGLRHFLLPHLLCRRILFEWWIVLPTGCLRPENKEEIPFNTLGMLQATILNSLCCGVNLKISWMYSFLKIFPKMPSLIQINSISFYSHTLGSAFYCSGLKPRFFTKNPLIQSIQWLWKKKNTIEHWNVTLPACITQWNNVGETALKGRGEIDNKSRRAKRGETQVHNMHVVLRGQWTLLISVQLCILEGKR